MKEFNLEEAKAGKPVCTRDGKKARIICWDRKGTEYPIVALVIECGEYEDWIAYNEKGKARASANGDFDLMMATKKKEGWVNLYRVCSTVFTGKVYNTEKEARKKSIESAYYLTTIKTEWEE